VEARLAEQEGAEGLWDVASNHAPRAMAARVIAPVVDGTRRRLWIAIPDGAHVFRGQVVMGPAGVLGTVREVHARDAMVQLLADGESRWGAELREVLEAGVLQGTGSAGVAEFRPEQTAATLAPGDVVVTSGRKGSTAPAGLPLGTVREVSTDFRGEKRAVLDLAEPGEGLRTVYLLEARQEDWNYEL
jgi:cell shape-determining protein MreC